MHINLMIELVLLRKKGKETQEAEQEPNLMISISRYMILTAQIWMLPPLMPIIKQI